MQTLSFRLLRRELEAAGTAPSVIARITQELKDHCADAESDALARGLSRHQARVEARASLGTEQEIVSAIASRPSLLDWRHRWPQSARCIDSLAWCIAVPAAPFVYCATHPASIVRWGLSSSLAALITASILFSVQLAISQWGYP
jgi:hypothetical protein